MERKVCTIGEWLDVWYEVYAVPEYAPKTLEIYRDARKRLSRRFPEIESTLLTELLPVTFQKALNDLSKKYAKSSLRHIKSLYNLAYQTAIKNHQCTENPISGVTVPKKASEKVVNGLSREEQQAFEEAAKQLTIRDQFILQTFLLTGLRRGELQNLRWQDWDKKAKVLRVEKSKTENGIRSVPVIPEVALMLTHLQGWAKRCSSNRYILSSLCQLLLYNTSWRRTGCIIARVGLVLEWNDGHAFVAAYLREVRGVLCVAERHAYGVGRPHRL